MARKRFNLNKTPPLQRFNIYLQQLEKWQKICDDYNNYESEQYYHIYYPGFCVVRALTTNNNSVLYKLTYKNQLLATIGICWITATPLPVCHPFRVKPLLKLNFIMIILKFIVIILKQLEK